MAAGGNEFRDGRIPFSWGKAAGDASTRNSYGGTGTEANRVVRSEQGRDAQDHLTRSELDATQNFHPANHNSLDTRKGRVLNAAQWSDV
jgi:hypothetical protein